MSCIGRQVTNFKDDDNDPIFIKPALKSIRTYNIKSITQIYTDWANHYLEKAKFKRYIQDLQVDVCDGILLADVIEAVTAEKVKDVNRKPKTVTQMIDNIKSCLALLATLGVNIDGITPRDVRDGNLKTILGLFFSLSRFKQRQKASANKQKSTSQNNTMGRPAETSTKLPAPTSRANKTRENISSSIPASATRHYSSSKGLNKPASNLQSDHSKIPSSGIPVPGKVLSSTPQPPSSFIPQPKSTPRNDKPASVKSTSGLPQSTTAINPAALNSANLGKNSMLDKFKFFKDKDKGKVSSKRTSSSSGFSSARSEKSDSSTSLCSEPKGGNTSSTLSTSPEHHESSSSLTSSISNSNASSNSSPKLAIKALARKTLKKNESGVKNKSDGKLSTLQSKDASASKSKGIPSKGSILKPKTVSENSLKKSSSNHAVAKSKTNDAVKALQPENPIKQSKISALGPKLKSSSNNSLKSSSSKDKLAVSSSEASTMQSTQGNVLTSSQNSNSSAIPKPTAAVKGTTKPQNEEKPQKHIQAVSPATKLVESPPVDVIPNREIDMKSRSNRSGTLPKAMVSPIMSTKASKNDITSVNNINNLTKSKMETNPDKVISQELGSNKLIKDTEDDETSVTIKPMNPLSRVSQYGYISGHLGGLSSTSRNLTPSIHIPTYRLQHDIPNPMKLQPLAKRNLFDTRSVDDYSDADSVDMSGGYMSDGDMLRANTPCFTSTDLTSGYMSEGGASLYARTNRISGSTKLKESGNGFSIGPSIINDDSFDDSSSLSSGISDTIAELNSDDFAGDRALYGNIRRHNIKDGKIHIMQTKKITPSSVQGPKPGHKQKSDSSMQTDSSAFRQLAYKKLESKALEGKAELRRGKSDLTAATVKAAKERSTNGDKGLESPKSKRKVKHDESSASSSKSKDESSKSKDDSDKRHHKSSEVSKKSSRGTGTPSGNGSHSKRLVSGTNSLSKQKKDYEYGTTLTAQVPGIQRTDKPPTVDKKGKVKVSGSTQTSSHDINSAGQVYSDGEYSLGRKHKHYGVINSSTLPGNSSSRSVSDYQRTQRLSISSEHSSPYSTIYGTTSASSSQSHYAWLRGREAVANTSGRFTFDPVGSGLTEADSMESLSNVSNTLHAQLQHARANSLTHARLLLHQRELAASVTPGSSPRLTRSNSIRSTKSEKMYPSMFTRSEDVDNLLLSSAASVSGATDHHGNNGSQPTSPSSQTYGMLHPDYMYMHGTGRFTFPLSPNNSSSVHRSSSASPYMSGVLSKVHSKDDELHGSALSLASTASSIYTTPEDKHAHEIRKLKRELDQAHDKVHTLTSHLNTNGHVVAAFEQSLSNMTSRLQHLTATAEQKDSELSDLRNTIEMLRNKSAEASSMIKNGVHSSQIESSHYSPHITRRHTFNDNDKGLTMNDGKMCRQMSVDSVSSLSSACSMNSSASKQSSEFSRDKKKKKGWLRSSFSKAFSRSKKNRNGSVSDVEDMNQLQSDNSAPNSPLLLPANQSNANQLFGNMKSSQSSSAIYDKDEESAPEAVTDLKKQLREKDMVLTDIRLEALTSAHQLESMKEQVNKMRSQMMSLKQDNERLQKMVTSKSLGSSQSSLQASTNRNSMESIDKKLSASENSGPSSIEMLLAETQVDRDGKRVSVSVYLGCHGDISKCSSSQNNTEVLIGSVFVSGKTKWDLLDNIVRRAFKEYVLRVDPASNLGLSAESIQSYHIGDISRSEENKPVELLPCGYLVGDDERIKILLRGTHQSSIDALAFNSLIPKSIIQRYISLLTDHRRIILCGPSGTGKSYLAQKLAEFLVLKSGKELSEGMIATFGVDHKSAKELRQYLSNIAEQCESNASDLPSVIILDNLHHIESLAYVFNGFLNTKYLKCPYIIGTMNQATCSTTNLQLHHNFRWVLCANHMEPVKGFLGRYLRKKLVEHEAKVGSRNADLNKIIDWMPRVWQNLNKFLETHSSSDVTIGPRLFLSCPVDIKGSQIWFTDLWNYSIIPYLLEAVREGLQLYGRRAAWDDPSDWVMQTYPWSNTPDESSEWPPQLLKLRPEDVGYDGLNLPSSSTGNISGSNVSKTSTSVKSESDSDPLLNMLMRLQEAASYGSPHSSLNSKVEVDSETTVGRHSSNAVESTL